MCVCAVSYWRTETSSASSHPPAPASGGAWSANDASSSDKDDSAIEKPRLKKLRQWCNAPDRIHVSTEGRLSNAQYELVGIIVTIRHGDRGPLIPIRNLSDINCSHRFLSSAFKHFSSTMQNISKTAEYSHFAGSFLKYPVLPSLYRCNVGHLTQQGVVQHLKLGKVLKEVYVNQLDLINYPWEAEDVIVHSTKFRRTFQSSLAFLNGFLPKFDISQLRLEEGRGITFCNHDCRCDRVAVLDERHEQEKKQLRKSHPGVVDLVAKLSSLVKDGPGSPDIVSPAVMRDALLAYTCHGHKLPCKDGMCVQSEDLSSIISYEEWETKQRKSRAKYKSSKLKTYGLLKEMLRSMDTMMRDGKPKAVLFSGHDKTLSFILESLGVPFFQLPHYASRIIFEVYRNNSFKVKNGQYRQSYYFRVIYNGKDVTKFLSFCTVQAVSHFTGGNGVRTTINLCPVADLDNYIRANNYFAEFNATTFKGACSISKMTTAKQKRLVQ